MERDGILERTIQLLVEFDKKGQELVQQAQEKRRDILGHMGDYKREMSEQYRERSDNRVEFFRQQAQSEKDEQLAAMKKGYDEQMDKLREVYQQNSEQWIAQIVARCIGG